MNTSSESSGPAYERYVSWERSAAPTFVVLVLVVAASLLVHIPSALFALGSAVSGVTLFFAWRSSIRQKPRVALGFMLLALGLALLAMATEVQLSIRLLLAQGLGLVAAALFACILATRRKIRPSEPEV